MGSPGNLRTYGEYLLERFPHLTVDVHHPQLTVMVEIRDFGAYIHAAQLPGAGGMAGRHRRPGGALFREASIRR